MGRGGGGIVKEAVSSCPPPPKLRVGYVTYMVYVDVCVILVKYILTPKTIGNRKRDCA